MRAVASPAAFAGRVGGADAGPQTPGTAAHDDPAHGSPFATVLATRLVTPKAAAGQPSSGDQASDAERTDETADAEQSSAVPTLLAAVASAMTPAAAPAASTATAAASVTHVSRDPNSLAPALRDRLGRVVARMQREYGDTVQIAEAGRTQARQNFLFAQGRTRSGPVVTWTRDSAHTRGRAVDVTINGGYDDAAAFARLQQIAQSEGLRTLGARDPGHLELPRGIPGDVPALASSDGATTRITVESVGVRTETGPASAPAVAPVAAVAAVAPVAAVAGVASVASVANIGLAAGAAASAEARAVSGRGAGEAGRARGAHDPHAGAAHASSSEPNALPDRDVVTGPGGRSDKSSGERSGDGAPDRDTGDRDRVATAGADVAPGTIAVQGPASGAPTPGTPTPNAPAAASTGAPVLGAVAAERIARVLDAQQAAAPRTVSHLTVRVDRPDGGTDRIHLDLRGRAVDARIDVADLGTADALTARTPELRSALAQHGLTTDDVRVRSSGDDVRAVNASAVTLDDSAIALGTGSRGVTSQSTGDGGARDGTPDQPSRDPGSRDDRPSDGRSAQRDAQDGGASGRRAGDQRQGRRTPVDDRDTPVQRPAARPTR